ncbi:MAG: hypothetical protein VR67_09745 [Peptococcaceae bacterium BRH_c8a]|nr:MAG: hypothetical protein VR67_09745 [Peptococcaceae bacterium BRH_c8a]
MNRKVIIILAAVVLLATMAMPAFADNAADAKTWLEQRFNAKQEAVQKAVEEGRITAEQGEQYTEHMNEMYKFHEANGFVCPFGNQGMMGAGRGSFGNQGQGLRDGTGRHGGPGAGFRIMQPDAVQSQ